MSEVGRRSATGAAVLREHLTAAITRAGLEELADLGHARLSMESVARRAGAGKSALYQRWPAKLVMVTTSLAHLSVPLGPVLDTGDLHGDLVTLVQAVLKWLTDPRIARVLPDLVAEAARTPALAAAVTATTGGPRRAHAAVVLHRAVERGELPADADLDLALDLLAGPVLWHLVVRQAPSAPTTPPRWLRSCTAPWPASEQSGKTLRGSSAARDPIPADPGATSAREPVPYGESAHPYG